MEFHRYVALGDSFTEGVGDADPTRPNGVRGWADRVAEVLAMKTDDFGYANLAIRGRKLPAILEEQLDPAIALQPDLVTIHGGGNDVLRPRVDLDALAAAYDEGVGRLTAAGAHVALFTIADPGLNPSLKFARGRVAVFNEWAREIAEKHGATLVDMWRMRGWKVAQIMDVDRLHMSPVGHAYMAVQVLDALGVDHGTVPPAFPDVPELSRREQLSNDAQWAREHLAPWVHRRVTGRSSGDGITPKRPTLQPIAPASSVSPDTVR